MQGKLLQQVGTRDMSPYYRYHSKTPNGTKIDKNNYETRDLSRCFAFFYWIFSKKRFFYL